jgi:prophage maintenance system killer protein
MVMAIFVGLNRKDIEAPEDEVVAAMVKLAAGRIREVALAKWIGVHLVPQSDR